MEKIAEKGDVRPALRASKPNSREDRIRRLQAVYALRRWMQDYPELFGTQMHVDCFVAIGLLTADSNLIPSLGSLYSRLSCARENSIRSHLRSLASGGWISFVRGAGGDRRSIGVRIEPPLARALDEFLELLESTGQGPGDRPDGVDLLHRACPPRISP